MKYNLRKVFLEISGYFQPIPRNKLILLSSKNISGDSQNISSQFQEIRNQIKIDMEKNSCF